MSINSSFNYFGLFEAKLSLWAATKNNLVILSNLDTYF